MDYLCDTCTTVDIQKRGDFVCSGRELRGCSPFSPFKSNCPPGRRKHWTPGRFPGCDHPGPRSLVLDPVQKSVQRLVHANGQRFKSPLDTEVLSFAYLLNRQIRKLAGVPVTGIRARSQGLNHPTTAIPRPPGDAEMRRPPAISQRAANPIRYR